MSLALVTRVPMRDMGQPTGKRQAVPKTRRLVLVTPEKKKNMGNTCPAAGYLLTHHGYSADDNAKDRRRALSATKDNPTRRHDVVIRLKAVRTFNEVSNPVRAGRAKRDMDFLLHR